MAKYDRVHKMKFEMRARAHRIKHEDDIITKSPFNSKKTICTSCGFEAYYKFKKCPKCDIKQE